MGCSVGLLFSFFTLSRSSLNTQREGSAQRLGPVWCNKSFCVLVDCAAHCSLATLRSLEESYISIRLFFFSVLYQRGIVRADG